jgi:hypothetical protein
MRRRFAAAQTLAGVFMLLGIIQCRAGEVVSPNGTEQEESTVRSWFITYKRPMAPPGGLSQIVTQDRKCLLTVSGPVVGVPLQDKSEIGRYAIECPAAETTELKRLTTAALEAASATRGTASPRGTRFLSFGVGEVGKDVESLASVPMTAPFPPEIRQLDEGMLRLAATLLEHPQITLAGSARCASAEIAPRQEIEVLISLRSSGTSAIRIRNPAAAGSDAEVGLDILLERESTRGKQDEGERTVVRLKPGEVVQPPPPGSTKPTRPRSPLKLAPGEELVLSAKLGRSVYLSPGSYRVTAFYTSSTKDIGEEESVEGRLSIPAGSLSVKAER